MKKRPTPQKAASSAAGQGKREFTGTDNPRHLRALTALLRLRNGQLAELAETRQLLALAVEEAVQVARAAGVLLPYANPVDKVLAVAVATGQNQSSMLQDVLRGSPTEIAVINGAIVREGERLGVATPVNRTLTLLVQALEKNLFPS